MSAKHNRHLFCSLIPSIALSSIPPHHLDASKTTTKIKGNTLKRRHIESTRFYQRCGNSVRFPGSLSRQLSGFGSTTPFDSRLRRLGPVQVSLSAFTHLFLSPSLLAQTFHLFFISPLFLIRLSSAQGLFFLRLSCSSSFLRLCLGGVSDSSFVSSCFPAILRVPCAG